MPTPPPPPDTSPDTRVLGTPHMNAQVAEDNLIHQLRHHNKSVVALGDDTWAALYPSSLYLRATPLPSFDVWDLHSVDDGILRTLYDEVRRPPSPAEHTFELGNRPQWYRGGGGVRRVDGRYTARRSRAPGPHTHGNAARHLVDDRRAEVRGQRKPSNDPRHIQHSPGTPTTGLRERGNDTSRSTGRSGRQNAATRRNMRRGERVTVQGPVKEQPPDGMSHRGQCKCGRHVAPKVMALAVRRSCGGPACAGSPHLPLPSAECQVPV